MKHTLTGLTLLAVMLLAPLAARADARVDVNCSVDARGVAQCAFRNTGTTRASVCATMRVERVDNSARGTEASRVCSATIAPGASSTLPARFPGVDPVALCADELGAFQPGLCAVQVRVSNLQFDSNSTLTWVVFALVLASALWVFFDARRLGVRRGLLPGFFDLSPARWFFATALFWIVGFPCYLLMRGRLRAAAQAARARGQHDPGAVPA